MLQLESAEFTRCLEREHRHVSRGPARLVRLRQADRKIESLALLDVYGRVARPPAGGRRNRCPRAAGHPGKVRARTWPYRRVAMVSRVMKDLETRGIQTCRPAVKTVRRRLQNDLPRALRSAAGAPHKADSACNRA